MSYKEEYYKLKKEFNNGLKKDYFDFFSLSTPFFIEDSKNEALIHFDTEALGINSISLYLNYDGIISYTYYAQNKSDYYKDIPFISKIYLVNIPKVHISGNHAEALRKKGIRLAGTHVLVPLLLKEGYPATLLKEKELALVNDFIFYLYTFIKSDIKEIQDSFLERKIACARFNEEAYEYATYYKTNIEYKAKNYYKPVDKSFVENFAESYYDNDTLYISRSYLPIITGDKTPFDSILLAYYKTKGTYSFEMIECKPNSIGDYIFAFLADFFEQNGIPTSIVINDEKIYSKAYNTLKKLKVDVLFERENDTIIGLFEEIIEYTYNEYEEAALLQNKVLVS